MDQGEVAARGEALMAAQACCAKCGSMQITFEIRVFLVPGILVYCATCGAIVSWVPKPE
jgi:hypothetical protein